jgi:hypothetical protein
MLSCSIWFSAPSFATHGTIRTVHTTYAPVVKTTTHPKLGAENHILQLNI